MRYHYTLSVLKYFFYQVVLQVQPFTGGNIREGKTV